MSFFLGSIPVLFLITFKMVVEITKVIPCQYEEDKKYIELTDGFKTIVLKVDLGQFLDIVIGKLAIGLLLIFFKTNFFFN